MKLKIVSTDMSPHNTKVINADTEEMLSGVARVEIVIDANSGERKAVLTFVEMGIDIIADEENILRVVNGTDANTGSLLKKMDGE